MGCTWDVINIKFKTLNDAKKFVDFFNDFLKDYFYDDFSIDYEDIYEEEQYENIYDVNPKTIFFIDIDQEPLFKKDEGSYLIKSCVTNFITQNPNVILLLQYIWTYNNCSNANLLSFIYNADKIIIVKELFADKDAIYECEICGQTFEEALMFFEDYEVGKTCICPKCGATLSLKASLKEYKLKII